MTKRETQRKQWRFFFVDGKPHRLIRANYARDEVYAWSYFDEEVKLFQWSDIRRSAMRGFTFKQVSEIVHRTKRQILNYIYAGELKDPPHVHGPGKKWEQRLFSEEDILKIQDIIANKHFGAPRKDGSIKNRNVPSRQEVYAKMKYDMTLYVQTQDGKFVPLYQAEDW